MSDALNVKNRTIFTDVRGFFTPAGKRRKKADIKKVVDNLLFLRGINSECVDLVYLDPPFNSKRQYRAPLGNGKTTVFDDTWRMDMVKAEWVHKIAVRNPAVSTVLDATVIGHRSDRPYLIYMAVRLLELRRVLKPTGSIYLHCDPTMSHWLKLLLDAIFGVDNFRNEIVWGYSGGGIPRKDFPRKHDIILRYTKTDDYYFFTEFKPYKENTQQVGKHSTLSGGDDIDLERGTPVTDWWTDIKTVTGWSPQKTGYKTQKPLALLERIIAASCPPAGVVLDPFCGCATACIAAEKLGRQWIGMDVSPVAYDMVKKRLQKDLLMTVRGEKEHGEQHILTLSDNGDRWQVHHRLIPPARDDGALLDIKGRDKTTLRERLYALQNGFCNGCNTHFEKRLFTVDHIIPQNFGGLDIPTNLQLLCGACNSDKGAKTMDEFAAVRKKGGYPVRDIAVAEYREKEKWEMRLEKTRATS